ncbi:MAG: branched-chain amino acid ABC transporter substrate-binding protein, partial [Pseudorhodobacter sp.]|nr:branched-chain amino acid ABC transporter substrate-binding protein [Rhizobacter sp.]
MPLSLALLSFGGLAAAKDTVKIAFIGPLTGGVAANGIGGRNSADLAVKLHNEDPKSKYKIE